jgi:hypothetical protein
VKRIPLTNSEKFVLVDDEDFEWCAQHSWFLEKHGYVRCTDTIPETGVKRVRIHRFIMKAARGIVVDHENHDLLDCRRKNLRVTSQSRNIANSRIWKKEGKSSKFKGVYRHTKGKWLAHIKVNRQYVYLGLFVCEEAAARRYNEEAKKRFGEFCFLNPV